MSPSTCLSMSHFTVIQNTDTNYTSAQSAIQTNVNLFFLFCCKSQFTEEEKLQFIKEKKYVQYVGHRNSLDLGSVGYFLFMSIIKV